MNGRVNQKLRTRQALIDAGRELAAAGRAITIADVAAAAQVSPATAYRYFSSPQELLRETVIPPQAALTADLPADPAARIDEVVRRVTELQLGDEALWRAVLAASLERWSGQADVGPEGRVPIRGSNRMALTRTALEPLERVLPAAQHRRLTMALMLVYGMEALVSARDACGLDADEAAAVMRWAAQALLRAALAEAG